MNDEQIAKAHLSRTLIVSIASSLITALVIQLGGALWWGSKIEDKQTAEINELKVRYAELNESGTKRLPLIDQRLKSLEDRDTTHQQRMNAFEDRINSINPLAASRFDAIVSELKRLDRRQDRFSEALDAMYNEFQEHLRNPTGPAKNIPLPRHD